MRFRHFAASSLILTVVSVVPRSTLSQTNQSRMVPRAKLSRVPFVGCASDGQVGPFKPPVGRSKLVAIPAEDTNRVAYYQAENGFGILAPRGWNCFSAYGSDGSSLFISRSPIDTKEIFSPNWDGFTGEAIQLSISFGGTSGRFAVAKVIARVFPAHKDFVQRVMAEETAHGVKPETDFSFGPYPKDKLRYIGNRTVEFETSPRTIGLGTDSRLQMNENPIWGVAILFGEDPDLVQLSVRTSQTDLVPMILKNLENEVAHSESESKSAN